MGALQDLASGNMGGIFGSLLGRESGLDDCMNILGSTRFADLMIRRFDLETRYEFRKPGKKPKKYYHSDVVKRFRKNFSFEDTDEGALRMSMKDTSAEMARRMVAYAIYALDSLYTHIQRDAVQKKLAYVDQRLSIAESEARMLEDSMVSFQKQNDIIVPEAQARLVIQSAAQTEVRRGILEEELALEANMRGTSSAKYADLQVQKRMVEETLRKQVDGQKNTGTLMPATRDLPSLIAEYFRLERAYTIRLAVYKFLVQQSEMLKLDAERNIQVISVVDPPWTNNKRVSPKRRVVVEAVFILSFLASVAFVVVAAAWKRHREENPSTENLIAQIKAGLTRI
jgi:capsule polysaccharide export protein KpsE/RkpR